MKKFFSLILVLALVCCLVPSAFAADSSATDAANTLYELGLFSGTGTDKSGNPVFDLEKVPDRAQAVTMLVNLLGKSDVAKAGSWTTPFTDVPEWAKPFVGYAYENGLTSGLNATTFGSNQSVSANQYITLVLRALGYKDGTDFTWDKASLLSDKLGLTSGDYGSAAKFLRGDIAKISASALTQDFKGTDVDLSQIISLAKAVAAENGKDVPVDEIAAIAEKVIASNGKLSAEDISAIAKTVAAEYDTGLPIAEIADIAVVVVSSKGADIPADEIAAAAKSIAAKYGKDVPAEEIAGIASTIVSSNGSDIPAEKIASLISGLF